MMNVYNSLTRRVEELKPLEGNEIRLYTCGPTVYNFAHIGNFRAYAFEDILRRVIQFNGMKVKQIFTLFAGEPANVDWLAVITAACREVEGMLLPDADDTDVRLEFLAAAVANSRAQTIRLSSGKSGYEYAGSIIAPGKSSSADFAAALLRDYMELCRGLIKPKVFIFETIPTKEDT